MRCRNFDADLPEWVKGALEPIRATEMAAHIEKCSHCRQLMTVETQLRSSASLLSAPELPGDLWPMVAHRLEHPVRPRPTWSLLRWATTGALTALLAAGVLQMRTPSGNALVAQSEELRTVRMIAAMEPVNFIETDADNYRLDAGHDARRVVLLGGQEP